MPRRLSLRLCRRSFHLAAASSRQRWPHHTWCPLLASLGRLYSSASPDLAAPRVVPVAPCFAVGALCRCVDVTALLGPSAGRLIVDEGHPFTSVVGWCPQFSWFRKHFQILLAYGTTLACIGMNTWQHFTYIYISLALRSLQGVISYLCLPLPTVV